MKARAEEPKGSSLKRARTLSKPCKLAAKNGDRLLAARIDAPIFWKSIKSRAANPEKRASPVLASPR